MTFITDSVLLCLLCSVLRSLIVESCYSIFGKLFQTPSTVCHLNIYDFSGKLISVCNHVILLTHDLNPNHKYYGEVQSSRQKTHNLHLHS